MVVVDIMVTPYIVTFTCRSSEDEEFPFKLKMVNRDGLSCCRCPWYR